MLGLGTVTVNGTTYTSANVFLDGPFVAAPVTVPGPAPLVQLTSRFSFTGRLRATSGGLEILREDLVGEGDAVARLFFDSPQFGFFDENNSIGYRFDPAAAATPEPASCLLLGTGVAALLARRKRGRASVN